MQKGVSHHLGSSPQVCKFRVLFILQWVSLTVIFQKIIMKHLEELRGIIQIRHGLNYQGFGHFLSISVEDINYAHLVMCNSVLTRILLKWYGNCSLDSDILQLQHSLTFSLMKNLLISAFLALFSCRGYSSNTSGSCR